MATLLDLKQRIRSVENIGKITRAMQLVAAAKLNRAQSRAHGVRPYTDELDRVLGGLAGGGMEESEDVSVEFTYADERPPVRTTLGRLFSQHEVKKPGIVLVTGDRGLCGAFNTNLIRAAQQFMNENSDKDCKLITIGKKGQAFYRRRSTPVVFSRTGISDKLELAEVKEITGKLIELYANDEVDALYFIFAKSIRAALYKITVQKFLSIPPVAGAGADDNYIIEPGRDELFADLLPLYATSLVFSALADSFASEYGARMAAMQQATKNAEEKLGDLVIERNRLRQATITRELAEIVGGAEALK
ncbi:MAG: ATP synthase F1 subunit gamma [Candidatus Krumholzibacteria bacterium]|nr:ATP synthase F1 subunit gamma [Candidatus Krumholzibacteria bacterium]MDH5270165.1 ATP synthase F1 subunit gamma [Candidatus Krumholzibacteria bacterium]